MFFPTVEKHLLCGREYFLQTSTEFPHFTLPGISIRIRLEGGKFGMILGSLTQGGENDSQIFIIVVY